jgi:hypothetical protein
MGTMTLRLLAVLGLMLCLGCEGLAHGSSGCQSNGFSVTRPVSCVKNGSLAGAGYRVRFASACTQACWGQYNTCANGCGYVADAFKKALCFQGCTGGRNSCLGRC